jgi:hypothetical protein
MRGVVVFDSKQKEHMELKKLSFSCSAPPPALAGARPKGALVIILVQSSARFHHENPSKFT